VSLFSDRELVLLALAVLSVDLMVTLLERHRR
jgi:hypothetical protein